MPSSSGPNTVNDSIVFNYDIGDVANSYKGEPTTNNYGSNFRDFTGTGYSPDGEWTADPTRFTKTYYPNLPTPIGPGATLIQESGVNGYHHLSRYGGGSESGAHSLSCYLYPLTTGITDFCIGLLGDGGNMIFFNLDNKTFSYGGGISNGNAIIENVPGWPGWLRVGANFEGRFGGWVGSVGYSQYTSYTGTAGGKPCYITGMQYEYQTHPTPFTPSSRSNTQALLDISGGNSTLTLANMTYDNSAMFYFDGTDDYISVPNSDNFKTNQLTLELIIKFNLFKAADLVQFGVGSGAYAQWYFRDLGNGNFNWFIWGLGSSVYSDLTVSRSSLSTGNYYHIVCTTSNSVTTSVYYNGTLAGSAGSTAYNTAASWTPAAMTIGGYSWDGYSSTNIAVCKIYNRVLSTTEIQNNYLAYKTRFNLS